MVAANGNGVQKVMGWMWVPMGGDHTHPAETPKDEAAATRRWSQNLRGPRLARIAQVRVDIEKKASKLHHVCVVDGKNASLEVPKHMVLHEREGFLLIQELLRRRDDTVSLKASWLDAMLTEAFEKHAQGKFLPSAQYVNKLLIKKAVTGVGYVDEAGSESSYRRDMKENIDEQAIPPGVEQNGFFCLKDIVAYMPPWEAFCHAKCGFYQDFYKVRWAAPYSEVDYGNVENGCSDSLGCTWEPDENLPSGLDSLRTTTKKAWSAAQAEREVQMKRKLAQDEEGVLKRPRFKKEEEEKKVELARFRRDKNVLERDLVNFTFGHDLMPEKEERFSSVRKGWPLHPKDYPTGFGVASPPGFCWDGCDCMDDQRGQAVWEVTKSWLPKTRTDMAQAAINHFTNQSQFVRARGMVSKTHYFETSQDDRYLSGTPGQRCAADLSVIVQGSLREVVMSIPASALASTNSDPFELPTRAIISIKGNGDYLPLDIQMKLQKLKDGSGGGPPPKWLLLDRTTGVLSISPGHRVTEDVKVEFCINFHEGAVKMFSSTIMAGNAPPHTRVLDHITQWHKDPSNSLDVGTREVLDRQLELARAPNCSLSKFVNILTRCQSFLRASSVASLLPARRVSRAAMQPRTPP